MKLRDRDTLAAQNIAAAVRAFVSREGLSAEAAAESLGVSRGTYYQLIGAKQRGRSRPRSTTYPSFQVLRAICDATGASADWLLGYSNIPVERDQRAPIGALARELHSELVHRAPRHALVEEAGPASDAEDSIGWSDQLISEVVGAWWSRKRAVLGTRYALALETLADRLDLDSHGVGDRRIATMMRAQASDYRRQAALIRTPRETWREVQRLRPGYLRSEIPHVTNHSRRVDDRRTVALLEAPFLAIGGPIGTGIAWRADGRDYALFIDAESFEVRREEGRFLRDLTLAEAYGG